jgi:ubiquinone/menaquinone biosynthesis C-methylase UbiE
MGSRVLDIGGEIDGAARTLAAELGCVVVVLVFAEDFCELGAILTAFTKLSDQVSFHVGNTVAAPFPDVSFDAVCKALASIFHTRRASTLRSTGSVRAVDTPSKWG